MSSPKNQLDRYFRPKNAYYQAAEAELAQQYANKVCESCGEDHKARELLLCDVCEDGYHLSCLKPALKKVPKGEWVCPPCRRQRAAAEKRKQELKEQDVVVAADAAKLPAEMPTLSQQFIHDFFGIAKKSSEVETAAKGKKKKQDAEVVVEVLVLDKAAAATVDCKQGKEVELKENAAEPQQEEEEEKEIKHGGQDDNKGLLLLSFSLCLSLSFSFSLFPRFLSLCLSSLSTFDFPALFFCCFCLSRERETVARRDRRDKLLLLPPKPPKAGKAKRKAVIAIIAASLASSAAATCFDYHAIIPSRYMNWRAGRWRRPW